MSAEHIPERRAQVNVLNRTFDMLEKGGSEWTSIEYQAVESGYGLGVRGFSRKLEIGGKSFIANLEFAESTSRIESDNNFRLSRFRVRISSESKDASFIIPIYKETDLERRAMGLYLVLSALRPEYNPEEAILKRRELASDFYEAVTSLEDFE